MMELPVNVFGDKASLIFRALLREPEKHWTVHGFAVEGLSTGQASKTVGAAEDAGYLHHARREKDGSFCRVADREKLLRDWSGFYSFQRNTRATYFYRGDDFLKDLSKAAKDIGVRYALTLYSASRLMTPYVMDSGEYVYLEALREEFPAVLSKLETRLGLTPMAQRANVCLALPYYKSSVFRETRMIKGQPVVSDLQLYLDFKRFPPVGEQELKENLLPYWRKRGLAFAA